MAAYGRLCGWTLARAHARSGDRIAIASYLGGGDAFDRAILEFSGAYAEQNERDYQALVDAVESGRVKARDRALIQSHFDDVADAKPSTAVTTAFHLTGNLSDRRGTRRAGQLLGRASRARRPSSSTALRLVGEVALGVRMTALLASVLYLRHGRRESRSSRSSRCWSTGSALTELFEAGHRRAVGRLAAAAAGGRAPRPSARPPPTQGTAAINHAAACPLRSGIRRQ